MFYSPSLTVIFYDVLFSFQSINFKNRTEWTDAINVERIIVINVAKNWRIYHNFLFSDFCKNKLILVIH